MSTRLYTNSTDNTLQTFESIVANDTTYYAVVLNEANETMFKPINLALQSIDDVVGTGPRRFESVPETLWNLHNSNTPMFVISKLSSAATLTTISTTPDSIQAYVLQTPTDYLPIGDVCFGAGRIAILNQVLIFAHKSICCTSIDAFITETVSGTVSKTFRYVNMESTTATNNNTTTTTGPSTDTPSTDTPSTDTPSTDTPSTDTPSTDTPSTDTSSTDTSSTDASLSDLYTVAGTYFRPTSLFIKNPVAILKACCIYHPGQAKLWFTDPIIANKKGTLVQTGFIKTAAGPIYMNNSCFLETKNMYRGALEFITTPMKALEHLMELSLDPDMSYRDALWKDMVVHKSSGTPTDKGAIIINAVCAADIVIPKYAFVCQPPTSLSPSTSLEPAKSGLFAKKGTWANMFNKTNSNWLSTQHVYYIMFVFICLLTLGIAYCCKVYN